jgi:hypothetical protein
VHLRFAISGFAFFIRSTNLFAFSCDGCIANCIPCSKRNSFCIATAA